MSRDENPVPSPDRRKRYLVKRELQVRMIVSCVLIVTAALVVQGGVLAFALHGVAQGLPNEGLLVIDALPGIVATGLLASLALLAPLVLALGLRYSHSLAGPLFRIEETLKRARAGEPARVGTLRKGDELGELAALVDEVLARLPEGAPSGDRPHPEPPAPLPSETRDEVRHGVDAPSPDGDAPGA